jgi:predicted RecB family nuclease
VSNHKITPEVLAAYLNCKYKAYLILSGVVLERSAHEQWLHCNEEQYANAAARALVRDNPNLIAVQSLSREHLKQGTAFIIRSQVEQEHFAFSFHALQRVPGASALGSFHYVPVLFSNTSGSVSETQKLMLCCEGLILEQLQLICPEKGILVSGDAYKCRTIDLERQRLKAHKVLNDLTGYLKGESKPRLHLNDHCRICRYQQYCKIEVQRIDDLSLLNRMSEREIQLYQRKGILTVNQLSYTFRFRKRGKRVMARGRPHSFPLQALARREQSVFVVSTPTVVKATTRIYIDMEGSPSGSFVYLIGMVIVENGVTRHQSFWADSKDDEEHIIDQFLEYLFSLSNPHLFYYGSYEARIFRRIIPFNVNESIIASSTNVLSLIYANIYFPTYSNELKEVGRYLGCRWSSPDATGHQTILWRSQWETSHDPMLKDRLITYNREDCLALKKITEVLSALPQDSTTRDESAAQIRFIEEIKTDDGRRGFGRKPFVVDDFAPITERAYFDYQRDKIYLRSNPSLTTISQRKRRNRRRRSLRPNKRSIYGGLGVPFARAKIFSAIVLISMRETA